MFAFAGRRLTGNVETVEKTSLAATTRHRMQKKKLSKLLYPICVIAFGVVCIVSKSYSHSVVGPVTEGPLVVFVGILFCLFGIWGVVATLREFRKKEDLAPPGESPHDCMSDSTGKLLNRQGQAARRYPWVSREANGRWS